MMPFASVLNRVLSLVGGRAIGNLLTLVYTVILARISTPEDFGLLMTGFAWAMLLSIGLALNVESGSIRYLVQYRQAAQPGRVAGFLRFNRFVILGMTLGLAACFGVVRALGLVDAADPGVQVFALALIAAPVVALTRVYGRHATALGQVLRGGLPIMVVRPAVICLLVSIVWISGLTPGTTTLMLLMLVAFIVTALVQAIVLQRTFAFAREAPAEYGDARCWLGTGGAMAPLLLMRDNLKHVVVASAGLVLDPAGVGYVALAFSIMGLFYFSIKAVDMTLAPHLSRALLAQDMGQVARLLGTAARLKLSILLAGVLGIALLGRPALGAFGPDYRASMSPLLILMLIPAADALLGAAQIVLNVTGRQRAVFASAGVGSALLVAAVALGGWTGGVNGAAAGAGLSYLVQQMMLRRVSLRETGIETSVAVLWRGSA